jgi:hypothetical protein
MGFTDPIDLSRRVLRELGMHEKVEKPLVARSFQSNLKYKVADDLQEGVEKS